jgi:glutathione synthase/RimK-type ligase-like ATP-grasp enzyme
MLKLIIVENPEQWPFDLPDVKVIDPIEYITAETYQTIRGVRIINLCKSYLYQTIGYYVSLLAEARKHAVIPSISTIQDLRFPSILREDAEDFDVLIQSTFKNEKKDKAEFIIFFGSTHLEYLNKLSKQLFQYIQAPVLMVSFTKKSKWILHTIKQVCVQEVVDQDRTRLLHTLKAYITRKIPTPPDKKRYDLAILVNPEDNCPPSDEKAIQRFVKAGDQAGFNVELLTKEDFGELVHYDALFIRETTYVNHHTFKIAKKAKSLGLAVIDDPDSILKCTNKVYLYELLSANKIPTPKSFVLSKEIKTLPSTVAFPFILKQPDGAFSKGVFKIDSQKQFEKVATSMFQKSDLLIAQEYLPTPFDWRIGIVDGKPLFVCKYFMASQHWQIVNWKSDKKSQEGKVVTIPVEEAPEELIKIALKAASLIVKSLYGVDMKEVNQKYYVIEINDNPNIDAGIEDKILKDKLYSSIMDVFLKKIRHEK